MPKNGGYSSYWKYGAQALRAIGKRYGVSGPIRGTPLKSAIFGTRRKATRPARRGRRRVGRRGKRTGKAMTKNMPNQNKITFDICNAFKHTTIATINNELLVLRLYPFDTQAFPDVVVTPRYFSEWSNFYNNLKCYYVMITGSVRNIDLDEDSKLVFWCDRVETSYLNTGITWPAICKDPNIVVKRRVLPSITNSGGNSNTLYFKYKIAPFRLFKNQPGNISDQWATFTTQPTNATFFHLHLFDLQGDALPVKTLNVQYQVTFHCQMSDRDKSNA